MSTPLIAAVLSPAQQAAVDYFRALNVPASWFIGEPGDDGSVEVLALGKPGSMALDDPEQTFVWSIRIEADGEVHTSEASVMGFMSGIDV